MLFRVINANSNCCHRPILIKYIHGGVIVVVVEVVAMLVVIVVLVVDVCYQSYNIFYENTKSINDYSDLVE